MTDRVVECPTTGPKVVGNVEFGALAVRTRCM